MQKGLLQNAAYIQDMDGILTSRIPYFVYNSHFATALPYILFLEKSGWGILEPSLPYNMQLCSVSGISSAKAFFLPRFFSLLPNHFLNIFLISCPLEYQTQAY